MGSVSDDLSQSDKDKFYRYINSEEGHELLADFAEQVVRTRSQTAVAALAIHFIEPIDEPIGADSKAEAAQGLDGISERSLYAFQVLATLRFELDTGGDSIR